MGTKAILIVDDEESILSTLKNSLKKLGGDYEVFTALSGYSALEQLKQRKFDLIVTDYRMDGMDGLELIKEVRALRPEAQTILMTAFGNETIEAEAHRLQVYGYLQKPFKIDYFRQVVINAMKHTGISGLGNLSLFDENYMKIGQLLSRLQADVGARYVLLVNAEGHCIVRVGNPDDAILEGIVPLLSASIAGLIEAGRVAGGEEDTVNLAYQESEKGYLYVANIGPQLLLIMAVNRNPYNCRIGSVWYLARETINALVQTMDRMKHSNPLKTTGGRLDQAVENELEKLFCGEDQTKPSGQSSLSGRQRGKGTEL